MALCTRWLRAIYRRFSTIALINNVTIDYLLDLQSGLTKVIAQTTGATTDHYIHAIRGIHAMQNTSGDWTYAVQDGLGSVRSETDSTLNVSSVQNYAPYGEPFGTVGNFDTPFAFTGEQTDPNDLLFLRARYYNPSLAIFPSLDPFEGTMARPMSLNGYSWVEGNPVMRVDPLGLVYLTFDDGPHPNDRQVLDILAQYDAKATFFFHGSNINNNTEDIVWRVAKEGHRLGNHSWEHQDLTEVCLDGMVQSVLSTRDSIVEVIDERRNSESMFDSLPTSTQSYILGVIEHGTGLFRAPGGDFTTFQIGVLSCTIHTDDGVPYYTSGETCDDSLGLSDPYLTYRWDVDPWDWYLNAFSDTVDNAEETLYDRIFNGWTRWVGPLDAIPLHHGGIDSNDDNILLHSNSNLTVQTLPRILQEITNRGYTFDLLTPAWRLSATDRYQWFWGYSD